MVKEHEKPCLSWFPDRPKLTMFQYNHNEHYADLLLRQVPSDCQNALDIGCGDGGFAQHLADRFGIAVTGIDQNRAMIERAQVTTSNPSIQFVEADFMQYDFDDRFDLITATASLHHMPFEPALEKMASLLRPGGVLAVLGVFREASVADVGIALVASPVNVFYALSHGWSYSGAPTRPADMSLREIHESVSSHLPNACLRRLLLWRYLLTWQKPQ
jgi:ubiquinone/menaquinone biosynthesis C-methylase UbiE